MKQTPTTRTFEYQDDKSSKLWEITQTDTTVVVRFGKSGTQGQSQEKTFEDAVAAAKHAAKLIAEKTGKGYVERGPQQSGSALGSSAPADPKATAAVAATKPARPAKPTKSAKPKNPAQDPEATAKSLLALLDKDDATNRLLAKHPKASAELLEKLSHSSDKPTRQAVALNPNTPKATLVRLAPQFPADFFMNPAFDWLLLEDPDLLNRLEKGVLKHILKRPECPPSFMAWAVAKGGEQEKLAVAMNPAASAELVAKLSLVEGTVGEAARAHANAAQPAPSGAADGCAVVKSELRSAMAELQYDEATSYWKRGILGPSKWAALNLRARLEVLGLDDWAFRDDWLSRHPTELAELKDESLQAWLKDRRRAASPDFALARDIGCEPAALEKFAGAKDVELLRIAACNPSMSVATLRSLAMDKRTAVREAVAANQSAPEETLRELASDKQSAVRAQVAGNPASPPSLVAILANDKASEVSQAAKATVAADIRAARSIRTPTDQLTQLASAKKAAVRLAVARNISAPEDVRAAAFQALFEEAGPNKLVELADEPSCPITQRNRARARRWWRDIGLVVEKFALPSGAEPLPEAPEADDLVRMLSEEADAMLLDPGRSLLARALGYCEGDLLSIPNDEADTACNAKARAVRLMGLMHPQAGPDAMAKRSKSTDWVERLAIACNPACAPSILSSLEKDANQTVARQVAATRQLKAVEQERRAQRIQAEPQVEVSLAAAVEEVKSRLRLKSCRTFLLQGTFWWPSLSVEQRLPQLYSSNPGMKWLKPVDLIAILEGHSASPVGSLGSGDPLREVCNWRERDQLLTRVADGRFTSVQHLRVLAVSTNASIRALVASSPHAPDDLAVALAADRDPTVRRAALTGGKCPPELVTQLLDDPDPQVKAEAVRHAALSDDAMRVFSQTKKEAIREGLALNKGLPISLQRELALDTKPSVRASLAGNPVIDCAVLLTLAKDKNARVRMAAAKNTASPQEVLTLLAGDRDEWVRHAVAHNPGAAAALLVELVADQEHYVREAAKSRLAQRSNLSESETSRLANHPDPEIRRLLASNRNTSEALWRTLAADPHPSVRLSLAWNERVPDSIVEMLVADQNETVLQEALAHPHAPGPALERAAHAKDPKLRMAVARNPSTPEALLEQLAGDPEQEVRTSRSGGLLKNPSLPLRFLDKLAPEVVDTASYLPALTEYFPALVNAARSASTSPAELQRLGRESFYIVRFVALANPRYPGQSRDADRAALHHEILNKDHPSPPSATAPSVPELLIALSSLDLLPPRPDAKWAARAAKSKDWLERIAVPLSGAGQPSLLQLLVDDPVELVRQLAISRLRDDAALTARPAPGH
jgi:predicted DNA-binding WGR domain protein